MGTRMLRLSQIYGKGNPIPVGKTKFFLDFVYREGGEELIPGTRIPRLRLTYLGLNDKIPIAFEDEVYAITEALRLERDTKAKSNRSGPPHSEATTVP